MGILERRNSFILIMSLFRWKEKLKTIHQKILRICSEVWDVEHISRKKFSQRLAKITEIEIPYFYITFCSVMQKSFRKHIKFKSP